MNNYKDIEKLLERYWECDTTMEEETSLRNFFLHHDNLPSELEKYRSLFIYQQKQQQETLSDDFEARLMDKLHKKDSKRKFPIWLRVVAGVVLLIGVGFSVYQYQMQQQRKELAQAQARETVIEALCLISENLQQGEQMIDDALEQFNLLEISDSTKIKTTKL